MNGRPERAQTNVRLVRRAQPRATRSHALPLTVTIVVITVFVAASFTRATEPVPRRSVRGIRPWCRPRKLGMAARRLPDAPSPGTAGPSAKGTSSAPPATSVAPVPSSSPTATMPPLPACRYADEPAAHAAYDDWQRTIVDTTSRLPKGYVPPDLVPVSRAGLSGGGSIRRIAIADLKASQRPRGRPGCDSRSSRPTGARPGSEGRSRVGYAPQEKPRPDVSVRAPDTRSTSSGPPSISGPRAAGPRGRKHSRARGMRDGWRPTPGGSAGSRAIRRVPRHRPATALRPGTTATSDGTSPPRSTRRG